MQVETYDHERISLNREETSEIGKKIIEKTWDFRYQKIISPEGYNNGKKLIKLQNIQSWIDENSFKLHPVTSFIEGNYFYCGVEKQQLFVDFCKLKMHWLFRQPINYFMLHTKNEGAYKLYDLLKKEGYYIDAKLCDPNIKDTIVPEMLVRIMDRVFDSPPPDVMHMLFIAYDPNLLPVLKYVKKLNIKLTLALIPKKNISNYYLNHFDYYINLVDLLEHAKSISKKKDLGFDKL